MSEDNEVRIPIKTIADTSGVDQANRALGTLEKEGEKAGTAVSGLGKGSFEAGHMLHGLEMAAEGSSRGMFTAGANAGRLLEALGAGPAAGPIMALTSIAAVVEGLSRMLGKSEEAAKKAQAAIDKLVTATETLKLHRLETAIEDLKRLESQTERAAAAQDRLNESRLKLLDAQTQRQISEINQQEQAALLNVKPGDEMGRKRVELEYEKKREGVTTSAAAAKADEEAKQAATNVDTAKKEAKQAAQTAAKSEEIAAAAETELEQRKKNNLALQEMYTRLEALGKRLGHEEDAIILPQMDALKKEIAAANKLPGTDDDNFQGTKKNIIDVVKKLRQDATAAKEAATDKQAAVAQAEHARDAADQIALAKHTDQRTSELKLTGKSQALDEESRKEFEKEEKKKAAAAAKQAAAEKALRDEEAKKAALDKQIAAEQRQLQTADAADRAAHNNYAAASENLSSARRIGSDMHQGKAAERQFEAPFEQAAKDTLKQAQDATKAHADTLKSVLDLLKEQQKESEKMAREIERLKSQAAHARIDSSGSE